MKHIYLIIIVKSVQKKAKPTRENGLLRFSDAKSTDGS